jgi:hypothetical protein
LNGWLEEELFACLMAPVLAPTKVRNKAASLELAATTREAARPRNSASAAH